MRANRADFGPLAHRPADAARRLRARHVGRAVRPPPLAAVPARPGRRAGDGPPAGRRRGRARGARRGRAMVLSNQASRPMEEVAAALGDTSRWFQLYWSTSDELVESLVARAEALRLRRRSSSRWTRRCSAGARATSTSPTCRSCAARASPSTRATRCSPGSSRRPTRPPPARSRSRGRPRGRSGRSCRWPAPTRRRFAQALRSGRARAAVQRFVAIYSRPSLTWEDLPFLRERTRLPIVLKGILHPEDARRAIDAGDGRPDRLQSRRPPGGRRDRRRSPRCLRWRRPSRTGSRCCWTPACAAAPTSSRRWRSGPARCCIGRPYVYGLAIAGEAGVQEVLRNLAADVDLTMGLAGCRSVAEVRETALERAA